MDIYFDISLILFLLEWVDFPNNDFSKIQFKFFLLNDLNFSISLKVPWGEWKRGQFGSVIILLEIVKIVKKLAFKAHFQFQDRSTIS